MGKSSRRKARRTKNVKKTKKGGMQDLPPAAIDPSLFKVSASDTPNIDRYRFLDTKIDTEIQSLNKKMERMEKDMKELKSLIITMNQLLNTVL